MDDDQEKVRLEELEKKYKELKCVTLKLLTNTFTQPEFYLQAQQSSAVIEELHVDLITSNSLMLLSSPHKRQLISPARPIVPCPISPRIESAYYVKISKKKLKIYEKSHSMVTSIKEMLRKKRFTGSDYSQRLFATAMAHAPGISFPAAEILISASIRAFMHGTDLAVGDLDELIPKSCFPSQTKLSEMINKLAANFLSEMAEEIRRAGKCYYACDKGNKRGVQHFVKYVCIWADDTNRVKTLLLDIDGAGGTSVEAAKSIDVSMLKIDIPSKNFKSELNGGCTDAGGGGTGESLDQNLVSIGRMVEDYLTATCCLHGHSLTLCNPITKLLGKFQ